MIKQQNKGLIYAFIASVISGIAIFYAKISVSKIDPLILTTSRNLIVGMGFFTFFILSGRLNDLKKLKVKEVTKLLLISIVGGTVPFLLFFTGLKLSPALSANFINKTLFIWVALLASLFLGEKFKLIYLIGFIIVFIGNLLLVPSGLTFARGEILILSATILWSVENIIAKKVLRSVSSETVGLFRMGLGSLMLLVFSLVSNKGNLFLSLNLNQYITMAVGGVILFFYVFSWLKALKFIQANIVSLVLTFSVVVGNILNGSFAGFKLGRLDIISSVMVFTAIILVMSRTLITVKDDKTREY